MQFLVRRFVFCSTCLPCSAETTENLVFHSLTANPVVVFWIDKISTFVQICPLSLSLRTKSFRLKKSKFTTFGKNSNNFHSLSLVRTNFASPGHATSNFRKLDAIWFRPATKCWLETERAPIVDKNTPLSRTFSPLSKMSFSHFLVFHTNHQNFMFCLIFKLPLPLDLLYTSETEVFYFMHRV